MVRLLAVLALAVSCMGCAACGGAGCCGSACGGPAGCGAGCCDECGCGCDDPGACGCCDGGCCDTGCGDAGCCGECGCEPSCGCGTNCGGGGCCAGGCCAHAVAGCPIRQDCRNCRLFGRGCQACGYDQSGCECGTGPYPADYDYSACQGDCNSHNHWPGCCCGCCETYSGCCCQPQGPGCCASSDHVYNFAPGPPVGQTAYPYYTTRGPRDFLLKNPPSIGPY
jgi:hypothetical protein